MENRILNKITKITSPMGQTGKTTLANNLALRFAQSGYLTAVIELDRYTGASPYLNNTVAATPDRSLKKAMELPDEQGILHSFMHSEQHENLFFLSLRIKDEIHDLHRFSMAQIEKILRIARNRFDKVFIDVPMNYLDNGYFAALHFGPHQTLVVLDENIIGWHRLKQYDLFLKSIKTSYQRTALVVNKRSAILPDELMDSLMADLTTLRPERRFELPYLREMITACNEGVLLSDMTAGNKSEKQLLSGIDAIERYILGGAGSPETGQEKSGGFFKRFSKKPRPMDQPVEQEDMNREA